VKIEVDGLLKPVWIRAEFGLLRKSEWLTVKCRGYQSEQQARDEGEKLRTALILTGVINRFGVDCGHDNVGASLSTALREEIKAKSGVDIRSSVHGLDVFKSGAVRHFGMRGTGTALTDAKQFEANLTKALSLCRGSLTERQSIAALLINDSQFVQSHEAAFVMRVSAVEALCEQKTMDETQLEILDELSSKLQRLDYPEHDKEVVSKALVNARRQGIRSAYMAKIRTLFSEADAKSFDKLYAKRGKFVHDGLLRGELQEASDAVLDIATRLLLADIARR
jgi:hypothetical protein